MSKRKKAFIIILAVLVFLYVLLISASHFYLKLFIFPAFEDVWKVDGEYPYSDAAIPDDFAEYSMRGLKLKAPACKESVLDNGSGSIYLSNDMEKCDLQILVLENGSAHENVEEIRERPNLICKWLTGRGWLTTLGMKKIGYSIPESDNELMYLLEKMDSSDYNKFSPAEAYAFTKLSILKVIFIPSIIGNISFDGEHPLATPLEVEECTYYLEKDSFSALIHQKGTKGGRYGLVIRYYPDSDADSLKVLIMQSDDPELVQAIAASIEPA